MDGQTEGWTDGRMSGNSLLWPTGHRPLLLKKAEQVNVIHIQLNPALTEPPLMEFHI